MASKKKSNPNSKYWKRKADKLWAEIIRSIGYCFVCGTTKNLQAHHIVPKEREELRWDLNNGVCLCATHHRWCRIISAHQGSFIFYYYFVKRFPSWANVLRRRLLGGVVVRSYREEYDELMAYKEAGDWRRFVNRQLRTLATGQEILLSNEGFWITDEIWKERGVL